MRNATMHRWMRLALPFALGLAVACGDQRPVGPEAIGRPNLHAVVDGVPLSLSGSGTAAVDGIMSPGEWSAADSVTFAVALPQVDSMGPTTPATLYVMNDDTVLYFALRLQRPAFGGATSFVVEFDNDHDGARDDGDDVIGLNVGELLPVAFFDSYRVTCEGAPPNSAGCGAYDPSVDGSAGASVDSGYTILELAHPLRSSDTGHDISLSSGQTVGFDVSVRLFSLDPACTDWSLCAADTYFPTSSYYGNEFGDIRIAGSTGGGGDSSGTTTLSLEKTATGFGDRLARYQWWVGKQASAAGDTLLPGESMPVSYTVAVVRWLASASLEYGVRGRFCVSNTGAAATDSLILLDRVQYRAPGDSAFLNVPGAIVSGFPGHAVVAAGATDCYDYEVRFPGIPGVEYRNVGQALINNFAGHPGEYFGPEAIVGFTIPDTLPLVVRDSAAVLTDYTYCPPGLSCTLNDSGPWYVAGDDTLRFTGQIRNDSAPCGLFTAVTDSVTLTTTGGVWLSASAWVPVVTAGCQSGCTRSLGFWKTHAGFTAGNPDRVTPLLPIWLGLPGDSIGSPGDSTGSSPGSVSVQVTSAAQAVAMLEMTGGSPANGVTKLYAMLLAAKLNAASGVSASLVARVIADADSFLRTHDAGSWDRLSSVEREMVLALGDVLGQYNDGLIGPGPCR